jgi:hypothetical protein
MICPMSKVTIAILLGLSSVAELFGTVTVWLNYARGAELARDILIEIEGEEQAATELEHQNRIPAMDHESLELALVKVAEAAKRLRSQVGNQLERRWYLTAGLVAYVLGAILGLTAGFVALAR